MPVHESGTQSAMRLCLRRGGQPAHARRPRGQTAARESGRPASVARVTLGRRETMKRSPNRI